MDRHVTDEAANLAVFLECPVKRDVEIVPSFSKIALSYAYNRWLSSRVRSVHLLSLRRG